VLRACDAVRMGGLSLPFGIDGWVSGGLPGEVPLGTDGSSLVFLFHLRFVNCMCGILYVSIEVLLHVVLNHMTL
jgi:hypothetical protein